MSSAVLDFFDFEDKILLVGGRCEIRLFVDQILVLDESGLNQLRADVMGISDESKSGSVGLLLLRRFISYPFRRLWRSWKRIAKTSHFHIQLAFHRSLLGIALVGSVTPSCCFCASVPEVLCVSVEQMTDLCARDFIVAICCANYSSEELRYGSEWVAATPHEWATAGGAICLHLVRCIGDEWVAPMCSVHIVATILQLIRSCC
ncbi:hypothetical protein F511_07177 [Dorcoceras hygrometricum]|nr:hypothetical protein F511_07177 [Dorcoceras hygrometricum]